MRVHEFLGVISYIGGSGPKIAHFWRMQAIGDPIGKPAADIKAVEWLPPSAAIDRLSCRTSNSFSSHIGRHAVRRTLKRTPIKPPVKVSAQPLAGEAPPAGAKPHSARKPRWPMIERLTRRWQAAVGWSS